MRKIILLLVMVGVVSGFVSAECVDLGDGSDGALTVTAANTIVNTYTQITSTTVSSGSTLFNVNDASGFSVADEILIIQIQHSSNAGTYEFAEISGISGNTIIVSKSLSNNYYSGTFNTQSASASQIVRVPQYTDVTVNSGGSITAPAWAGYTGGIVVFRASETVNTIGSIDVSEKGFRGGERTTTGWQDGQKGESYLGRSPRADYDAWSNTLHQNHHGGGGGQGLEGGDAPGQCSLGCAGGGGSGGSYGTQGTEGTPFNDGWSTAGAIYGTLNLKRIYLGSGSGSGADGYTSSYFGGYGGSGGGIIILSAKNIEINGTILNNGGNGQDSTAYAGGGAGASGGSMHITAEEIAINGEITALGGAAGLTIGYASSTGGGGGDGRIRLDYNTLSGTTNPLAGYELTNISVCVTSLIILSEFPNNNLELDSGTSSTTLGVSTNINATCRYSTNLGQAFSSMTIFSTTGGTSHSSTIMGLLNGQSYDYYVKCQNVNNVSEITGDYQIHFSVANPSFMVGNVSLKYRKPINVTENSGSTLTDYQVILTVDTASLISEGKMQTDCEDIRFTDSDEITGLSYWIELGCNTPNTKVWVKVPSLPASSTKTIYMYYGNPEADANMQIDGFFIVPNQNHSGTTTSATWAEFRNGDGNCASYFWRAIGSDKGETTDVTGNACYSAATMRWEAVNSNKVYQFVDGYGPHHVGMWLNATIPSDAGTVKIHYVYDITQIDVYSGDSCWVELTLRVYQNATPANGTEIYTTKLHRKYQNIWEVGQVSVPSYDLVYNNTFDASNFNGYDVRGKTLFVSLTTGASSSHGYNAHVGSYINYGESYISIINSVTPEPTYTLGSEEQNVAQGCIDNDGDGYGAEGTNLTQCDNPTVPDCNDNNADINPEAYDIVGNGIDEDCSGSDASYNFSIETEFLYPSGTSTYYVGDDVWYQITIKRDGVLYNPSEIKLNLTNHYGHLYGSHTKSDMTHVSAGVYKGYFDSTNFDNSVPDIRYDVWIYGDMNEQLDYNIHWDFTFPDGTVPSFISTAYTYFTNAISNHTVKDLAVNSSLGKVDWTGTKLDLHARNVDLDSALTIGDRSAYLDSAAYNELNNSAVLTFENVNCSSPYVFYSETASTRDTIFAENNQCLAPRCTNIQCIGTTLTVDVLSFSGYAAEADANLSIDADDPKLVGQEVHFTADYRDVTDDTFISAATCTIYFTDGSYPMAEGAVYTYNRTFVTEGLKDYNVTCSKTGFSTLTAFDNATITSAEIPEFSILTLGLGLITILAGLLIIRRKR